MKKTKFHIHSPLFMLFISSILFLLPGLYGQVTKLELYPYMVVNETEEGDATLLVDEQKNSGDPLNGEKTTPSTCWSTSYGAEYPIASYIDLGQEVDLRHVFIFDLNGTGDMIIEYGSPEKWTYLFTDPLNKYKAWIRHDVNVSTRYLRVVKTSANPKFSEIILYADGSVVAAPVILDLIAQNPQQQSIDLSWTDVEGNSATGDLTSYDLRYATSPINEENFENCKQCDIVLSPSPGQSKSFIVEDLTANTFYYFAIKAVGPVGATKISNIASAATTIFQNEIEERLTLNPSMIYNESGMGDAGLMVNEQDIAGDPLNNAGGNPIAEWKPSYNLNDYPASAYIDLGSEQYISRIFFRDINAIGDVVVEYGSPDNWLYLLTEPCEKYLQWKQHDVNIRARFLRITLTDINAKFSEIVIYVKSAQLVEEKLNLSPDMISNPLGYGEAWKLADEQDISGDPANSPGGNPVTYWQTGFQSSIPYPLYAVLDLGENIEVTKLFIRDTYDVGEFSIWAGAEPNWNLVATDNLSGYLSWNQHDIHTETRFLRFEKSSAHANVAEIVVYGIDHTPGVLDNIPPADITDLGAVAGENPVNEVNLSWTAPGDDNMTGLCTAYQVRFSLSEITQDNFYQAVEWPLTPQPSSPGTTESMTIQGLDPGAKYYFAIMAVDDNYNTSGITQNASITTSFEIGGAPFKIMLTPNMVLNEYVQGDASLLVDEQELLGDPLSGNSGSPSTIWNPGSIEWIYPCYAMIDLKGLCNISKIYLYDADGEDPIDVFLGEPFGWNPAFTDSLQNTNTWNAHIVNAESRYIRLKINSADTKIAEIVVYASRLEEIEEEPVALTHDFPTMDNLIGVNAFIDDPLGRMAVAGFVREYHSWMWCEGNNDQSYPGYPNNQNAFNVMGWNFDYYYENFENIGITACPAIQRNVPWLTDFNYSKLENKPTSEGENPEDPGSYAEHADHLFQYAARYGNIQKPDNLLKLAEGQDRLTGQNWLNYYESWNEQDKWWQGRDAFFTPYEYAAMSSADRDGHLGEMSEIAGVKNADPDAKLVMGGLAKPDLNYIKAMKLWADYYRDGDMPVDVINVHHYCNDGLNQSSGNVGISPEDDQLDEIMKQFVNYRDQYLPDKEVWITEFGYDTHPQSVQRAPAIGNFSQEEVQAQWLVRSYLLLAATGVDRAAMYMLRDVDPNSSTKFNTSGLCASKTNNWAPKPSWYYVYTLKNRLAGMKFDQEISSGNPNVWIYKFRHTDNNSTAYAVWCPTSNETVVNNYELNLTEDETQALLIELLDGSATGLQTLLNIIDEKISVNVSETPVFILTAPADFTFLQVSNIEKLQLNASMIVNESGQGDPTLMVDEQELSGDPFLSTGGQPVSNWATSFGASYPVHAYLDLGQEYNIEALYLRDVNATGKMTISTGEPGNWAEVAQDNCGRYNTWSSHAIQKETRYVRITKYEPTANFSEILIYIRN